MPEKLLRGLMRACTKRDVAGSTACRRRWPTSSGNCGRSRRIKSRPSASVRWLWSVFRSIDLVAYIRFASVYRQFDSIEGFKQELEQLAKEGIR